MRYKFIDRILKYDEKNFKIIGLKLLTLNEDIFEDHFKVHPMLPAAMMSEACVELSRYFVWELSDLQFTILPVNFKHFKFYKMAEPGTGLKIENIFDISTSELKIGDVINVNSLGINLEEEKIFEGNIKVKIFKLEELHDQKKAKNDMKILNAWWENGD